MFDEHEINILLESLDAWEAKDSQKLFTELMMTSMLTKKEDTEDALDSKMKEFNAKELERKAAKEQSIVLKAKLIQLRDKKTVRSAENS